ncbi:aldose 1-epimerase [Streptomyces sioyaensis]|uniref:aldose 1-epimerase n=1 Tax=Streptomyces sioyaensis TaxID=67364 RepID=UPI003D71F75D
MAVCYLISDNLQDWEEILLKPEPLVSLSAPGVNALVSPQGGRISSLNVGGLELLGGARLAGVPAGILSGCFPMAPYAGRVRDGTFRFGASNVQLPRQLAGHAIHGLLWDVGWEVDGEGRISAQLDERWPFGGSVQQTFSLTRDSLTACLSLTAGTEPMPYSLGYHPWFCRRLGRGGDVELRLNLEAHYATDVAGLPTGRLQSPGVGPWDDCFAVSTPEQVLHWPGAMTLAIQSAAPNVVVFDKLADVVCVEPQSAPPDALNLDEPAVLQPHQSATLNMRLAWQLLAPESA